MKAKAAHTHIEIRYKNDNRVGIFRIATVEKFFRRTDEYLRECILRNNYSRIPRQQDMTIASMRFVNKAQAKALLADATIVHYELPSAQAYDWSLDPKVKPSPFNKPKDDFEARKRLYEGPETRLTLIYDDAGTVVDTLTETLTR